MSGKSVPAFLRFIRRVGFASDEQCWSWRGQTLPKGYGLFWSGERKVCAHRWIYEWLHGEQDRGLVVMHTCDNPNCVNPAHLKAGTYKDNTQDMLAKGRSGRVRLSADDVRSIRERYTGRRGEQARFAREYGVSKNALNALVHGRTWAELERSV